MGMEIEGYTFNASSQKWESYLQTPISYAGYCAISDAFCQKEFGIHSTMLINATNETKAKYQSSQFYHFHKSTRKMNGDIVHQIRNGIQQYPLTVADLKLSPQMHGSDTDYDALFQIYLHVCTIFEKSEQVTISY